MGNPNLTKTLFAGLVATFLIATIFGGYIQFISLNNSTIQEPYNSAFRNISLQYDAFTAVGNTAKNESTAKNIFNAGAAAITGTVNIFVVGLQSIGTFFALIPILGNIFSILNATIPGLGGLTALLTTIFGVYIAMSYIKSASNKQELP